MLVPVIQVLPAPLLHRVCADNQQEYSLQLVQSTHLQVGEYQSSPSDVHRWPDRRVVSWR